MESSAISRLIESTSCWLFLKMDGWDFRGGFLAVKLPCKVSNFAHINEFRRASFTTVQLPQLHGSRLLLVACK